MIGDSGTKRYWQHEDPLECPKGHKMIWLGGAFWYCEHCLSKNAANAKKGARGVILGSNWRAGVSMKKPLDEMDIECISCEEDPDPEDPIDYDNYKCPKSKRACGHHCNHSWSHEECCWCGATFGPMEESPSEELGREIGH